MREVEDVTIEYDERGCPYGILTKDGVEFREELPSNLGDYTEEKQRYWMRRCIISLERQFKAHLRAKGLVEVKTGNEAQNG